MDSIVAANKLELARGAGQRYLVQRWEDGTACDKTGVPRKIEVQVSSGDLSPLKTSLGFRHGLWYLIRDFPSFCSPLWEKLI